MAKNIDFEKSLKRLDEIVEKIENGNLSLEDNLKYYEEAKTLIKELGSVLSDAEKKVLELQKPEEK